jgi:hypothetical protein
MLYKYYVRSKAIIIAQSDSYRDPLYSSISLRLVSSGGSGRLLSGLGLKRDDWTDTHHGSIGHRSRGHGHSCANGHASLANGDGLNVARSSGGTVVAQTSLLLDLLLETVHTVFQGLALGLNRDTGVAALLQVGVVSTNILSTSVSHSSQLLWGESLQGAVQGLLDSDTVLTDFVLDLEFHLTLDSLTEHLGTGVEQPVVLGVVELNVQSVDADLDGANGELGSRAGGAQQSLDLQVEATADNGDVDETGVFDLGEGVTSEPVSDVLHASLHVVELEGKSSVVQVRSGNNGATSSVALKRSLVLSLELDVLRQQVVSGEDHVFNAEVHLLGGSFDDGQAELLHGFQQDGDEHVTHLTEQFGVDLHATALVDPHEVFDQSLSLGLQVDQVGVSSDVVVHGAQVVQQQSSLGSVAVVGEHFTTTIDEVFDLVDGSFFVHVLRAGQQSVQEESELREVSAATLIGTDVLEHSVEASGDDTQVLVGGVRVQQRANLAVHSVSVGDLRSGVRSSLGLGASVSLQVVERLHQSGQTSLELRSLVESAQQLEHLLGKLVLLGLRNARSPSTSGGRGSGGGHGRHDSLADHGDIDSRSGVVRHGPLVLVKVLRSKRSS